MKIGIDIGGSHIGIGVVDEKGQIIDKVETFIKDKSNIEEKIEKYFSNNSNIKFEKFNKREANESMILAKVKLHFKKDEEYKVSDLLNLMEELERILDLFIENKEYKN